MFEIIKRILYRILPTSVYQGLKRFAKKPNAEMSEVEWREKGCPSPPPHSIKIATIAEYRNQYNLSQLVETGTWKGDMINAQKGNFKKVFSIELVKEFWLAAKERFKADPNVFLYNGDSEVVMPQVLRELNGPALFWLDGHFMPGISKKGNKECPVIEELEAIMKYDKVDHVMLVDDARLFVGKYDYPSIPELTDFVKKRNPRYNIEVKYDIIRITPGSGK